MLNLQTVIATSTVCPRFRYFESWWINANQYLMALWIWWLSGWDNDYLSIQSEIGYPRKQPAWSSFLLHPSRRQIHPTIEIYVKPLDFTFRRSLRRRKNRASLWFSIFWFFEWLELWIIGSPRCKLGRRMVCFRLSIMVVFMNIQNKYHISWLFIPNPAKSLFTN